MEDWGEAHPLDVRCENRKGADLQVVGFEWDEDLRQPLADDLLVLDCAKLLSTPPFSNLLER